MEKLRQLLTKHGHWQGLTRYIWRIETFVEQDFMLAIENSKALIESVCKTILDERNQSYEDSININKLVKTTIKTLGIEGENQTSQFGAGIVTALQNLGELRNLLGDTGHGRSLKELNNNNIDLSTTYFLVDSVETIVCFLITRNETVFPQPKTVKEISYNESPEFNAYLDATFGTINVAGTLYPASELLYAVDPIAYRDQYLQYLTGNADDIE